MYTFHRAAKIDKLISYENNISSLKNHFEKLNFLYFMKIIFENYEKTAHKQIAGFTRKYSKSF